MDYNKLLKRIKLTDTDIDNVYQYGSRVYGTATKNSDWDFIIIVSDRKSRDQFSDNLIDVTFYTWKEFNDKMKLHEISILECLSLPKDKVWKETKIPTFKLDVSRLRHSLSAKSSNSFVKAKKKLTVEQDFDAKVGKKSLYHSFRIIEYGIQLATEGKISDYACRNDLYFEIMGSADNWDYLFEVHKRNYNKLLTEFRLKAPKLVK